MFERDASSRTPPSDGGKDTTLFAVTAPFVTQSRPKQLISTNSVANVQVIILKTTFGRLFFGYIRKSSYICIELSVIFYDIKRAVY